MCFYFIFIFTWTAAEYGLLGTLSCVCWAHLLLALALEYLLTLTVLQTRPSVVDPDPPGSAFF